MVPGAQRTPTASNCAILNHLLAPAFESWMNTCLPLLLSPNEVYVNEPPPYKSTLVEFYQIANCPYGNHGKRKFHCSLILPARGIKSPCCAGFWGSVGKTEEKVKYTQSLSSRVFRPVREANIIQNHIIKSECLYRIKGYDQHKAAK